MSHRHSTAAEGRCRAAAAAILHLVRPNVSVRRASGDVAIRSSLADTVTVSRNSIVSRRIVTSTVPPTGVRRTRLLDRPETVADHLEGIKAGRQTGHQKCAAFICRDLAALTCRLMTRYQQ